jgi:predicted S18 family serine protease
MDQRESHIRQDIEETHTAITEKIEMIENRMHETMEGTKSTIDNVMDNVKRVQGTIEDAKVTVDSVLDTIKRTMDETVERVNYAADLIDQVNQNPWIMFGSAVLMGYILSSANREGLLGSGQAHEVRQGHAPPEHHTAPRSTSSSL